MDKEQILTMPAGRELDALVAEKVIGLNSHYKFPIGEGTMEGIWFGDPPDVACFKIPNYSTDISAAWEVVEKMRSQGIFLSLIPQVEEFAVYVWCNIGETDPTKTYPLLSTEATTASLVICKAALLAVMEL